MHKYLEKNGEVNFDKIFNQTLGKCSLLFLTWAHLEQIVTRKKSGTVIVLPAANLGLRSSHSNTDFSGGFENYSTS